MTDWTPFAELGKREDFIRTSMAVHMASSRPIKDPRMALQAAELDWQAIERAMREDEEKRR